MNVRSLHFRLVVWYAFWLGAVFVLAGGLLYFGLRSYLENNLGVIQRQRAERIATLLTGTNIASAGAFVWAAMAALEPVSTSSAREPRTATRRTPIRSMSEVAFIQTPSGADPACAASWRSDPSEFRQRAGVGRMQDRGRDPVEHELRIVSSRCRRREQ